MTTHAIEFLERRLAPAGTVLLSTAGGTLTITGDIAANDIGLAQSAPGVWEVMDPVSLGSTLFRLNGGIASASVTFDAVQSIKATLNGGSDSLSLSGVQVNGAATIIGNDGDDAISITGGIINGALSVDGGNGADAVSLGGSFNSTISLKTGAGDDAVTVNAGFYGRGLTVDLGADSNQFVLDTAAAVTIMGPVTVSAAGGAVANQTFTLASPGLFIAGNVSFKTTSGATDFTIGTSAGNELQLNGSLSIQTAAGNDTFALTRDIWVSGGLTISAGAGVNSLDVGQTASLRTGGAFLVTGGLNNDTVNFNAASMRIGSSLGLTLGNGVNSFASVNLGVLTAAGLALSGGTGADTFTLQGSTVIIGGHATLALGAGNNDTTFDPSVSLRIGGSVLYTGDAGEDRLVLQGPLVTVGGQFSFKGGNGFNSAGFTPVDGSVGSISLTGGTGQDLFDIGDFFGTTNLITVHGSVVSSMGAGDGDMGLRNTLVYGAVNHTSAAVSGSDFLRIRESDILGAVNANMGGIAVANVEVSDSVLRSAFTLSTGGGNDLVNFDVSVAFLGAKNTFKGAVKIILGAGDDTFNAGVNPAIGNRANDFLASLTIDGGADMDTANFQTGYGNSFATPAVLINVEAVN